MGCMNRTPGVALLLALSPLACGGSSAHSHAGAVADPNAPPVGCQRTFCDLLADNCRATMSPSSSECGDAPQACRQTGQNTLCIDDLGDPDPSGVPCNAEISAASCACGDDAVCGQSLYDANPACEKCDSGWQPACLTKACPAELSQLNACLRQAGCNDPRCESLCGTFVHALSACVNTAAAETSDPGGCYTGAHACWVSPICP
jgi:hypothetical protein